MLNSSPAAASAIIGSPRRILARAILDIIDPDITYHTNTASAGAPHSNIEQLTNRETESIIVQTFEPGHFTLDGSGVVAGRSPMNAEVGFVSAPLGDANGLMSGVFAQINVSGIDMLNVCSVHFSRHAVDGYAVDFRVDIMSGLTTAYTREITGNTATSVSLSGFTAYNVTAIRVTPTKWSRPHTRARIIEIMPGLYEVWEGSTIYSIETYKEADFSMLTLPYGTATLVVSNEARRFNPRDAGSILRMIEARQPIPLMYGVKVEPGLTEWFPAGVYYQQNRGWETDRKLPLIKFTLVDIIGLVRDRSYRVPPILPTTLGGWVASIIAQLGANFADKYYVDPSIANFALTATPENVANITCGELLRLACMAAGGVCYADTTIGHLFVVPPLTARGATITRDNLSQNPVAGANMDIAFITFTLADGNNTKFVVNGTSTSGETTPSINNFFIHTGAAAQIVARRLLGHFGGARYETRGRGDLRSELGDFDTIEIDRGDTVGARRIKQALSIDNGGYMRDVPSYFVQPTGEDLFSNTIVITASGQYQPPTGVTRARLTLGQGGEGGTGGNGGATRDPIFPPVSTAGKGGEAGKSGRVWTGVINFNEGQVFNVQIGSGGAPGAGGGIVAMPGSPGGLGAHTTFGVYSSYDGTEYDGMIDITTGRVFAKNGVPGGDGTQAPGAPAETGTSNGGNGGGGGSMGAGYYDQQGVWHPVTAETSGAAGSAGASGFVIFSYDLPGV